MQKLTSPFAIFATSTGVGGMERLIASLAQQCAQAGMKMDTRLAHAPGVEATMEWLHRRGVCAQVEPAAMSSHQAQSWRSLLAFRKLLLHTPAGTINLHYGVSHISLKEVLAVRLAGRTCVATVHAATPWSECGLGARESTQRAAHLCRAIIVHSQATRDNLRAAGVPARKIHFVPCGIAAPAQKISRQQARTRLNLPADAFVIASAARLVREKGVDDLIAAVASMPTVPTPTHLIIAGDGPERNALEAHAACHLGERAHFLGQLQDVNEVYAAADMFALPSHNESLGLVFLEAAWHGIPSVGTRVGGIPEAVLDGRTGLLAPVRDPAAFAQALTRLRDDALLRQNMGAAAQARVCSEFSEIAMMQRYLAILQR